MIPVKEWLETLNIPIKEGWGYIWGTYGQTWTAKSKITSKAPSSSKTQAAKYGSKWIGKRVCDCSGLLYWAAKQHNTNIVHSASGIMKSYTTSNRGAITKDTVLKPGYAVFQKRSGIASKPWNHVGVYIGDGKTVEARGTQYGVVITDLSRWDDYGELKFVDYTGVEGEVKPMVIKQGDRGVAVVELQELLMKAGYQMPKFGADGAFGAETKAALMSWQDHNGYTADGVCTEEQLKHLTSDVTMLENVKNEPATYVPDIPVGNIPSIEDDDQPEADDHSGWVQYALAKVSYWTSVAKQHMDIVDDELH